MKALIINGGNGSRLKEITKTEIPKGHVFFYDRPLIYYQILALRKVGIDNIIIDYDRESYISQFNDYRKKGLLPDANYSINLRDINWHSESEEVPYCAFRSNNLQQKMLGNDITKIHSDNFFAVSDLKMIMGVFEKNRQTTVSVYPWKRDGVSHTTGITIFAKKDLNILFESVRKFYPRLHTFVGHKSLNGESVNVVELSKYINMNKLFDYKKALSFVKKGDFLK